MKRIQQLEAGRETTYESNSAEVEDSQLASGESQTSDASASATMGGDGDIGQLKWSTLIQWISIRVSPLLIREDSEKSDDEEEAEAHHRYDPRRDAGHLSCLFKQSR